jgi:hypothetical protein
MRIDFLMARNKSKKISCKKAFEELNNLKNNRSKTPQNANTANKIGGKKGMPDIFSPVAP